jgi:hypothetical protein
MLVMTFNNYGEWLIDDDYTIDGFTGAIGKNVVTVTAKGYSTTFDTYVYDDISTKKILISQTEYLYNGNECTPTITVINSNGKKLSQNTDYALVYENNVNPGLGKVYIYGIGNYNGSVTKTFIITPKQTTGLKVSSRSTTSLKLAWTKQSGVTGYVVQKYDSKNKKWATYKTITSNTNSITVSKLSSATTYKFRVRSYKTINGKKYYGDYSSTLTTPTKPAKVTNLKSVYSYQRKNNTDCFKTTWKKVSGATGYQLYYVREGNTSKTITVKNVNSYTYKVSARDYSALKVKIRAYKTVDGKKYYSDWSSYAKIKF